MNFFSVIKFLISIEILSILIFYLYYVPHQGNSYDGVAIQNIVHKLQGFTQSDIMEAVSYLSREGHIYSTIDENHWQFAS